MFKLKRMPKFILNITIFFSFYSNLLYGQNLIINEVSQGPSGSKEYVEFLVVPGSGPYQCLDYCLDLRGWIIDDNNGYFTGGGGTGLGIASGAVRFANDDFWSCVPIGTMILIYNDQDLNMVLPSIDNSVTDGNCKLVLPISSLLFENQSISPTTTNTTYPLTGWSPGGLWGPISMANGGDSFQVYNSSNFSIPVHGVSWVNNTTNNIIYFAANATNAVYYFANIIDNNPSNQANWLIGTCSAPDNQTPGLPNNSANAAYIQSLTNNCAGPLNASLISSTDEFDCQCNGSATISAIGSIPGYNYQWFDASNNLIGQNTATATNLCQGNYSCVVTSSVNCTDTVYVTINSSSPSIIPLFNQISPICSGETISLPSTSVNNIIGTWSPAINNTSTTTYTFTPTAGQCATTTTMTVIVNSPITPIFSQASPICSGGTFTLPPTSTNGITGTWSPAINNSATTTYTFTPDANQCATSTTMTVVVSNGLTPTFNQIPSICQGGLFSLPTSSIEGIIGTWSPSVNTTTTTTYTFTPNPGQCAVSATMTVTVSLPISPTFNQLGPFCQGSSAPSFSNTSLEGITGVWGPPGINTGAIGTNTYVFVANAGQCATNQSMSITVNPLLTPIFPDQESICFGDNIVLPTLSTNGVSGAWSPNMNNTITTVYTFTPSLGQCAASTNITVEVFNLPPIEAGSNLIICEGSSIQLVASGGIQYTWTGGIQNGQLFEPIQSQVYYVTGIDANGCQATDSVILTVVPFPSAQFSSNVTSGTAPLTVNFINSSSNATSFDWTFGDGNQISSTDLSNVPNTFLNPGSYTVWLVASNENCYDTISGLIIVNLPDAPILTVPNVLTPNGDGSNDDWFIFTKNISELEVIIINRWGIEVAKLDGIAGSWDGKTTNGDEVTDGTYFYKYRAKGINGDELSGHGFLSLIR